MWKVRFEHRKPLDNTTGTEEKLILNFEMESKAAMVKSTTLYSVSDQNRQ